MDIKKYIYSIEEGKLIEVTSSNSDNFKDAYEENPKKYTLIQSQFIGDVWMKRPVKSLKNFFNV